MGVRDRDWYQEALRERQGRAPSRLKKLLRTLVLNRDWFKAVLREPDNLVPFKPTNVYYAPRRPMTLVGKAILVMAGLIAASLLWRYFR